MSRTLAYISGAIRNTTKKHYLSHNFLLFTTHVPLTTRKTRLKLTKTKEIKIAVDARRAVESKNPQPLLSAFLISRFSFLHDLSARAMSILQKYIIVVERVR